MRILIVAATENEVLPLKNFESKHDLSFLITGVGMVATAYSLGRHLVKNNYSLIINAGIAGCFDKKVELGSVFQVTQDCFSELGAEDASNFISIDDLGFGKSTFTNDFKVEDLETANAITVNTVHGIEDSIIKIASRLNPTLESMEGAAAAFVCEQANQKYLQIRSVSNYVEPRNKNNWNIPLAIEKLNQELIKIIEAL